jgi:hypothetical protein
MDGGIRVLTHVVQRCPLCGRQHAISLRVRTKTTTAPLLFGGTPTVDPEAMCPVTREMFSISPRLGEDDELVEVLGASVQADELTAADGPAGKEADGPAGKEADGPAGKEADDTEYADWLKASRGIAIDFCKTMLTSSAGAIAIYFAILKYLGTETFTTSTTGWLSAVPPVLFLASVATFALGLRPRLAAVHEKDFPAFRAKRMEQLNLFLTAGMVLFLVGLILAFVVFARALKII